MRYYKILDSFGNVIDHLQLDEYPSVVTNIQRSEIWLNSYLVKSYPQFIQMIEEFPTLLNPQPNYQQNPYINPNNSSACNPSLFTQQVFSNVNKVSPPTNTMPEKISSVVEIRNKIEKLRDEIIDRLVCEDTANKESKKHWTEAMLSNHEADITELRSFVKALDKLVQ